MKQVPFSSRVEAINSRSHDTEGKWIDFTVSSYLHGNVMTYTRIRGTKDSSRFVDIEITELTGQTRRQKVNSTRLGEDSARELYLLLHSKFAMPKPRRSTK